jgi:AbrB family looped-hinge helix DNA binding protein
MLLRSEFANLLNYYCRSKNLLLIPELDYPTKKEILGMSKITYKFQVTIPKRVCDKFALKEGENLVFIEEDNRLSVAKSTQY